MSLLDFASTYFSSPPVLETLALFLSCSAVLLAIFNISRFHPRLRLRIVTVSFAFVVAAWTFVASSLLFCISFLGLYEAGEDVAVVSRVLGLSVLSSILVAVPLCVIVTLKLPRMMSRRLTDSLPKQGLGVTGVVQTIAGRLRVSVPVVLRSPNGAAFAYSVGGAESVMVLSQGMTDGLDGDELETVLAHELGHIKNHDTELSTTIAVYRRILFFDPFVRLFEKVVCREKEFSADELSARETGKPLALASALLKISSGAGGHAGSTASHAGLSILGSGGSTRAPHVKERIERLIRLAAELERSPSPDARL